MTIRLSHILIGIGTGGKAVGKKGVGKSRVFSGTLRSSGFGLRAILILNTNISILKIYR